MNTTLNGEKRILDKVASLKEGVQSAIQKIKALGFVGDMHPSSSTVRADIERFFKNDPKKQREILSEVKRIERETNAFFKSAGLGHIALFDLDRYVEGLESGIENPDLVKTGRLSCGAEYGLRFKVTLGTLRDLVLSLEPDSEE